jgi:HPt (histidine-containing phosphotransfer) domain-containing protein
MANQIAAAPQAGAHDVTLDRRVIAEFGVSETGGVPEFVVGLIEQFLAEAGGQVEQMREAWQRMDAPALKKLAHALRGSSNMIGAKRLGSLCKQLEHDAGAPGFSKPEALLSDVDEEFVKLRYALRAELQGAGER